jgi:hypothetical protein
MILSEQKKVEDLSTAELGLAYGKTVEKIYQMQMQAQAIEGELNTRREQKDEDTCETTS